MRHSSADIPPIRIPEILKRHGIRPDRKLGQVFLCDPNALQKVVDAAEITPEVKILEIGAGIGNLTRYLAARAGEVYAVEKDMRLLPVLAEEVLPWQNVKIIEGDILRIDAGLWPQDNGYIVVANIPYYITSAIIRHILKQAVQPARIILTIQKEVAERVCAQPGKLSLLALSVQIYGKVRICGSIPAGAFYPIPEVDSAILRVDLYNEALIPESHQDLFFRLAKAAFGQKRKMLRNTLSGGMHISPASCAAWLEAAEVDPNRRPESLTLVEWQRIVQEYLLRFSS
jgi:16S rRNA (adenine1518-N6/adenine1519-N6)-dimethyltransferase